MPPDMLPQMRRMIKPLLTVFAFERFLSCVRPHVNFEIRILRVFLAAHFAIIFIRIIDDNHRLAGLL